MINLGNKKLKNLNKGSEVIARVYKGDELIFQDVEAIYGFKFTVDTTLTQSGGHNQSDGNFVLYFSSNYTPAGASPITILWGDGTSTTNAFSGAFSHTYATPGEYQITLLPELFVDGEPPKGWLSCFHLDSTSFDKLKSIDKRFPDGSFIMCPLGSSAASLPGRAVTSLSDVFTQTRNLESAPDGLFAGAIFAGDGTNACQMFNTSFRECGINTGFSPLKLATVLFKKIDTTNFTDTSYMFSHTFYQAGSSSDSTIPSDIFSSIVCSNVTNFRDMFRNTFYYALRNSTVGTIPAGIFSSLDTSLGQTLSNMFYSSFAYLAPYSTVGTIPSGLFSGVNLASATTVTELFRETFQGTFQSGPATIPNRLFADLDFSNKSMKGVFQNTFNFYGFGNTANATIPQDLFDGVKTTGVYDFSNTFQNTFSRALNSSSLCTIPEGLFDFLDTSNAQTTSYMFNATFSDTGRWGSIPETLFSSVDMRNVVNATAMFLATFSGYGANNEQGVIPAGLFSSLNTPNVTTTSNMFASTFYQTFKNSKVSTLPSKMFASIDMTNVKDASSMFRRTFGLCCQYTTVGSIPADLFYGLDTSGVEKMGQMFAGTFETCFANSYLDVTVPANLFASFDTSSCTEFQSMFAGTFSSLNGQGQAIIPAGLFDFLDMSNASGSLYGMFQNCFSAFSYVSSPVIPAGLFSHVQIPQGVTIASYMFSGTFGSIGRLSTNPLTIPADLFSTIDTSGVQQLDSMFRDTFNSIRNRTTIPATLFATIDLSSATNVAALFSQTFQNTNIVAAPQGIFGSLVVPQLQQDYISSIFSYTFSSNSNITDNFTADLEDVFDGMSDFSWVDSSNAANRIGYMFSRRLSAQQPLFNGSANTVLQHFNFTPDSDTNMFQNQTNLTDYNTINANWK